MALRFSSICSFPSFTNKFPPCKRPSSMASATTTRACLQTTTSKAFTDPDYRPVANFSPCIWKDTFTSFVFPTSEFESYEKQVGELKVKVKEMLMASAKSPEKLIDLIDTLCRLGVSYHFEAEIEQHLNHLFEWQSGVPEGNDYGLHTVATLFRVLRQHGFPITCGILRKFTDNNGKFKKALISDTKGMLSLYEASHLGFPGEAILDEALAFTRVHLPTMATNSKSQHLADHISDALELPLHRSLPRIKTHKFISFYEHDESRNDTLLMIAKLDFNRVQLIYQQELSQLTSWWKELNLTTTNPYARDRLVEIFFYSAGKFFEPQYWRARLMYMKTMMYLMFIDDTYDAYATLEELHLFTDAIDRWDIKLVEELPEYMRYLYSSFLHLFEELDDEFAKEGKSFSVTFVKEKYQELVRAYHVEAQWFREGFMPSFAERLSNGILSSLCFLDPAVVLMGMGADKDAVEWLRGRPKLVIATFTVIRIVADIASHKAEQDRGHVPSVVECYMKQYGSSREEAVGRLREMVADAWKVVNEESMRPAAAVPLQLLAGITNVARVVEVAYREADFVSKPEYSRNNIKALFVEKLPL